MCSKKLEQTIHFRNLLSQKHYSFKSCSALFLSISSPKHAIRTNQEQLLPKISCQKEIRHLSVERCRIMCFVNTIDAIVFLPYFAVLEDKAHNISSASFDTFIETTLSV